MVAIRFDPFDIEGTEPFPVFVFVFFVASGSVSGTDVPVRRIHRWIETDGRSRGTSSSKSSFLVLYRSVRGRILGRFLAWMSTSSVGYHPIRFGADRSSIGRGRISTREGLLRFDRRI